MDLGKKGGRRWLGGVDGGETVAGIYCMREESIFNLKKKVSLSRFFSVRTNFHTVSLSK